MSSIDFDPSHEGPERKAKSSHALEAVIDSAQPAWCCGLAELIEPDVAQILLEQGSITQIGELTESEMREAIREGRVSELPSDLEGAMEMAKHNLRIEARYQGADFVQLKNSRALLLKIV